MFEPENNIMIERMKNVIRIGLIGDYDQEVTAHRAIPRAIELAANELACPLNLNGLQPRC
jgi:CTP synthase (UTP-ammonia lyase)